MSPEDVLPSPERSSTAGRVFDEDNFPRRRGFPYGGGYPSVGDLCASILRIKGTLKPVETSRKGLERYLS